jgi:DDE superfamily endonuclease
MSTRRPCPPAPGPLEVYAQQFDMLFSSLAQRRGFRDYLQGLLLPRDRHKTLTGLAGAEPVSGAQHREVQRLQWFLSESAWDHEQVNQRRVQLLCQEPATAPHDGGALVVDDTGDRKDGTRTAHVARQYLGSVGKVDNGIVASPACGPTSAAIGRSMPSLTPCLAASGIPGSRPSRSWPWSWSRPPGRQGSSSGRWWPTASTVTTPASPTR